jgi:branched-chain amino acid transport system permease protein
MAPEASEHLDLARACRDAAVAALIACGLLLPLIGFNTVQNIHNELILETRWPLLSILVAIVAGGRFVHSLLIAPWRERSAQRSRPEGGRTWAHHAASWIMPFTLGFAILYPALALWLAGFQGAVKWIDNFGVQILIYVMLGWGLNIVVGLAGLLDLGYVAFYAVGAYSYALLAKTFGLSFWLLLPLAGCLAAFWGILLGFPVLRLRGDYLAIVTLGFGEIIRVVILNVDAIGGARGFSSIPVLSDFFLFWVFLFVLVTVSVIRNLVNSSYGRAFVSIRDDEIAAEAMGVDTTRFKVLSFVISSMFAGIGGSLFGHYTAYLNPNSFTFITSFYLIIMIVIGGLGSIQGSIVGAVLITVVLEAFRSLSEFRLVGFSILLVLVMLYRPQGLMGAGEMFRLKRKAAVAKS